MLDACRELGASLLAYSPLEQGVLLGTYGAGLIPTGPRGDAPWFSAEHLAAAAPVAALLRRWARPRATGRPSRWPSTGCARSPG
nr:hypothetical protein [Deltaproteobacteria bacterium]